MIDTCCILVVAKRSQAELHMHSQALCIACNTRWRAVAPVSTLELACPGCQSIKGRFTFECLPPEGTVGAPVQL